MVLAGALAAAFAGALAAAVLAGAFAAVLAGAFAAALADVFTAATLATFFAPLVIALNSAPARNAGTEVFLTLTLAPVAGLRAVRAARLRFSKMPKPVMATRSPFDTLTYTVWMKLSTAAAAAFLSSASRADTASMNSALFTFPP